MKTATGAEAAKPRAASVRGRAGRRAFLLLAAAGAAWPAGLMRRLCLAEEAGAAGPAPGKRPLGRGLELEIGTGDRCPVCGMRPINHPKFACAVQLLDGRTFYFCSAGCMLRSWIHPDIFLAAAAADLSLPVTREYFSGRSVDARAVTWVAGSDVVGPMGPAFVALAGESHLEAFRRRHGGRHLFRLAELDDALWLAITGKPAGR